MNRLVLVGPYPPPWGGIAVHLESLRRLAHHRGVEVSIFDTGEGHRERAGEAGVHGGGGALGLVRAAAGAVGRPLHVHISGNNLKSWLVALALGRPVRVGRAGAVLTVHSGLAPGLLRQPGARAVARAACLGYRSILCTNAEILEALVGCGVARSALEVVPPFLREPGHLGALPLGAAALRARARPLLVAAVAEGPQYGAAVLLRALEGLVRALPDLGIAVYGPGSERLFAGGWAAKRGLEGRVVGLGPIDHSASLALIAAADVFVRPTLADGDSLSVREALALGVRVVASDVGRRPGEATLFRAGDPADLARAIEASWASRSPPKGSGAADSSGRLWAAWEAVGLIVDGGDR